MLCFFRNYDNSKYCEKLQKRLKTLVVPYIAWNTVGMLFGIVTSMFFAQYFVGRQPFEPTISNILKAIFLHTQNGPFWFIEDLLIFVVLSPVFYALLSNKYLKSGGGILILMYCFDVLPDSILFDSSSCIFYAIGVAIGIHYPKLMVRQ